MPGTSLGPRCDKATSRALYRSANPQAFSIERDDLYASFLRLGLPPVTASQLVSRSRHNHPACRRTFMLLEDTGCCVTFDSTAWLLLTTKSPPSNSAARKNNAFVGMITATAERSEARSEEGRRWQGVVDETAIPPQERYKRQRVGNRAPCISSLTQYVASTWYFFPSDNKVRLVAEMKFTAAILLVALLTAFMGTITAADERNDEARTGDIYGSGCPDSSACTKSCKAKGLNLGVCLEPLLKICLCS
ncbi:uncharacterized protein [Dermacentor albipictus]|uniref:uncharacterized protein isoform X2 n=1 Tax=Dermacentor albipictus TaxID=60249 RepID=UPI0038FBF7CD